jgi:hypothetical protein
MNKLILILISSTLLLTGCNNNSEAEEQQDPTKFTITTPYNSRTAYIREIKGMPCVVIDDYKRYGITCDWSKYEK